jgi:hypothetical protein
MISEDPSWEEMLQDCVQWRMWALPDPNLPFLLQLMIVKLFNATGVFAVVPIQRIIMSGRRIIPIPVDIHRENFASLSYIKFTRLIL